MLKWLIESRQFLLKACAKKYIFFLWERKKKRKTKSAINSTDIMGEKS